jgi:hypothetical protein
MNKSMLEITVETTKEGEIRLIQDATHDEYSGTILLHPDQVDVLISWLLAAKKELADSV